MGFSFNCLLLALAGSAGAEPSWLAKTTAAPWEPLVVFPQPEGRPNDLFGVAVALEGNTLAVGSFDDDQGNQAGAVFLFERHRGGHDAWQLTAKLVAFDGLSFDSFGAALTLDGDTLVVGAPLDDGLGGNNDGSAYVFERDRGGADRWGLVRKIVPSDSWALDHFATSVALAGDVLVVGSPFDDDRGSASGSVYVFERHAGGTDQWGQVAKLHAADTVRGDHLGFAVATDGTTLVAGARGDDGAGLDAGVVVVFERQADGSWSEVQQLVAPGTSAGDRLGWSLALDGDRLVAGAPKAGGASAGVGSGTATLFERQAGGWAAVATWTDPAGLPGDDLGLSVAVDGELVVVGAPGTAAGGALYGFGRQLDGSWVPVAGLDPTPAPEDFLGYSVAVERGLLAAGAIQADPGFTDAGEVVLFRQPGSTCEPGDCADQHRPVARIAPIATTFCDCPAGTDVPLDGTPSYDRDGDPLTPHWTNTAGTLAALQSFLTTGFFPVGATEISLEVDDGQLVSEAERATVIVDDRADALEVSTPFAPTQFGGIAFGDYDGDGDLDLALVGRSFGNTGTTRIYRNTGLDASGAPIYVDTEANLPSSQTGRVVWGDYDGDGDLDLLVTSGCPSNGMPLETTLYRNDGTGEGTGEGNDAWTAVETGLLGVLNSHGAFADIDNDGDLDITLLGETPDGPFATRLYRNDLADDGSRSFVELATPLDDLRQGWIDWADYDGDGDRDLLLTGDGRPQPFFNTRLYRNDGQGGLTEVPLEAPQLHTSSAEWADYDGDGDLDILITGGTATTRHTEVLRNDGGVFTNLDLGLPGVIWSSASWGDYDNDGDPDGLVTGDLRWPEVASRVFRNDGDDRFTDLELGLLGVRYSQGIWGDADGDGDLDILITGRNPAGIVTKLYLNQSRVANTPPTAPTGLTASVDGNRVDLAWSAASDAETPTAGLTYNLRVGRQPGGTDVLPPMADPATGQRWVVERGNTDLTRNWSLRGLEPGEYFWSAQAIDAAFTGSVFAPEGHFTIPGALDQDLPGYWSLDEGSGTTVTTPDGLVGNLVGGVVWAPGQQGTALEFDGTGFVEIPDDPTLDLTEGLTLAVWVRPEAATSTVQSLVSKDDAYELELGKTGADRWGLRLANQVVVTGQTPVTLGVWQHLAVTWDGTTVRAYFQGVEDGTGSFVGTLPDTPSAVGLGGRPSRPADGGPAFLFTGSLDDVRIYDRTLSAEGVAALVDQTGGDREPPQRTPTEGTTVLRPAGTTSTTLTVDTNEAATCRASTSPGTPWNAMPHAATSSDGFRHTWTLDGVDGVVRWIVRCRDGVGNTNPDDLQILLGVGTVDLVSDLVAHWGFDSPDGCVARDTTGQHPGVLGPDCPTAAPDRVAGRFGGALELTTHGGTAVESVQVAASPDLGSYGALTLSLWVRHGPTHGYHALVDHRTAGTEGMDLYLDPTSRLFLRLQTVTLSGSTPVADGTWHHVVATWDGATARLYVDGVFDAAVAAPVDIAVTAPLWLGRHFASADFGLEGRLDAVRLYHRALSPVEVLAVGLVP